MQHLIPEEFNILVTSDPSAGAQSISPDGDSFTINLDEPLMIPKDAKHIHIACPESSIWWTVPNIIQGENSLMYITENANNYIIDIPSGLYDTPALNRAISLQLENAGALQNPDLITLLTDEATQKVIIRANYIGVSVDFTQPGTFRDILGFNPAVVGPSAIAPENFFGDNVAAFNTINYFKIHSTIVTKGIQSNATFDNTITNVPITVAPGSLINFEPRHPAKSEASYLAGARLRSIRFWLTDQSNNPVNTFGEYWSTRLQISYLLPVDVKI